MGETIDGTPTMNQHQPDSRRNFGRRYAVPSVTWSRLAAAAGVTILGLLAGGFVFVGAPGLAGMGVAVGLGVIVALVWAVVLRQPCSITVGDEVVIRFPLGSRRYARDDIREIRAVEQHGGTMFLVSPTSRLACWQFRMSDGRRYVIPVRAADGNPSL